MVRSELEAISYYSFLNQQSFISDRAAGSGLRSTNVASAPPSGRPRFLEEDMP